MKTLLETPIADILLTQLKGENYVCIFNNDFKNPKIHRRRDLSFYHSVNTLTHIYLPVSESKQQLPVVKEPDGYLVNNVFKTGIVNSFGKPVYFSPQVSPSDDQMKTIIDNYINSGEDEAFDLCCNKIRTLFQK